VLNYLKTNIAWDSPKTEYIAPEKQIKYQIVNSALVTHWADPFPSLGGDTVDWNILLCNLPTEHWQRGM